MKRSEVIKLIASWGDPLIRSDVYSDNYEEWADNLLYVLETEVGMLPPQIKDPDCIFRAEWEPEVGTEERSNEKV